MTRELYKVIVARGIWKGFDVSVEPPTPGFPPRHFKVRADALVFASQLAALQGWLFRDRSEGDEA